MSDLQNRIDTLLKAIDNWLSSDNDYLMDAIDRTVREGYFSFPDITFALDALRQSISKESLEAWVEQAGLSDDVDAKGQNVFCLHAGNLPLVGFQDAFSTLLSGARYTGKISRKDPYLLPTFLNEVKKTAVWTDMDVQWTHRLRDFEDMRHDAIIFAGSESSVPDVKEAIREYNLAKEDTRYLIRTAHFSMAYLDSTNQESIKQLAEGMLRYGGQGCRSVAIVVSPFGLSEVRDELREANINFWKENPQHTKPGPRLRQQYAYNQAVERPQLWQEHYLIQEGGLEFDQGFICYWVEGDRSTVSELADEYGEHLQSIYTTNANEEISGLETKIESLASVQKPLISWKPDGVDTLEWLMK
ncbi:acyl-CoA reductase [Fodinibius salsisoli]|uniref:Acyl-CoA reductase (LuxC) n=1 Tax=Fodinibius salsisoli TaxID=2820877 RepID=A0ABT3PLJ1_9BACT|nr:acyl-CoA reductase [Fodinibius salsisoli]MCW9706818.1 hypothetical protein [Fodinibius salsisoli]